MSRPGAGGVDKSKIELPPTVVTRTETHRVIAALEKAIERLQLLTLLDERGPEAVAAAASQEEQRGVGGILEDQKTLEARYERLIEVTQKKKHNPADPLLDPTCFAHVRNKEEEAQLAELSDVSSRLKDQSKLLCRQLKDNPNDADNWAKIVKERADLVLSLKAVVVELQTSSLANDAHDSAAHGAHQHGSYENFALKVKEEETTSQWAAALVKKEQDTNNNVKAMQQQVKEERQKKEEMLEKCHTKIAELKTDLRSLKQRVKEQKDKLKAENDAQAQAQAREAAEKQRVRDEALGRLGQFIQSEHVVMEDTVRHTSTKLEHLEELSKRWGEKKQKTLDDIGAKKHRAETDRASVLSQLDAEEEALEDQKEKKAMRDSEKARDNEDREARESLKLQQYNARTKLQAAIKGFFTRTALIVLKKKAGKKKK